METLVELYVNEQFDDLVASFVFRPKRTVFLTTGFKPDRATREGIARFLRSLTKDAEVEFIDIGNKSIDTLFLRINAIFAKYPDCALEMTGGYPTALIAAQKYCMRRKAKSFWYDSQRKAFRSIYGMKEEIENAVFPKLDVQNVIAMGGGLVTGTGHSVVPLDENIECVRNILKVYSENINCWNGFSEYLQFGCRSYYDAKSRFFCAPTALLNKGIILSARMSIINGLSEAGALEQLKTDGENVSFYIKNSFIREILTTVGMCLELFVYVSALDSGCYDSVEMSVVFDWDGVINKNFIDTTNEIDVVMTKGFSSTFVSCKTAKPDTRDLYEIDYLAKRFGGTNARVVLATASDLSQDAWSNYMRARDMGIVVIEKDDIRKGSEYIVNRLLSPEWLDEKPVKPQ